MTRDIFIAGGLGALLLVSGCATQRVYSQSELGGTLPSYEKSQPFFVYGIGQTQETNAREICGKSGIDRVETTQTFLDGFLGVITLGIYTPRTVQVYCKHR